MYFFSYIVGELISLLVTGYLWFSVYKHGNVVPGYSLPGLLIYYVFTKLIVLTFLSYDPARTTGDSILNSEITNYLAKPFEFSLFIFFKSLGSVLYRILVFMPAFITFLFLARQYLVVTSTSILFYLVFLIIGYIIYFLFKFILGCLAFHFGLIMGLNFILHSVMMFMAGSYLPLDILPSYIISISNWLPFKFLNYYPISILNGNASYGYAENIFIGLIWIFLLLILANWNYKRGLKKFEAYGG